MRPFLVQAVPLFRVILPMYLLPWVPWDGLKPLWHLVRDWIGLGAGLVCIVGVLYVYVEITVVGLRRLRLESSPEKKQQRPSPSVMAHE